MSDTELTVEKKEDGPKDGETVLVVGNEMSTEEVVEKLKENGVKTEVVEDVKEVLEYKNEPEMKPLKPEVVPLPEVGKIFMMDGWEYKVTYVNEGKKRFSAEPCKKNY